MESITMPGTSAIQATSQGIPQAPSADPGTLTPTGGAPAAYSQDAVDLTETGNRGALSPNATIRAHSPFLQSQFATGIGDSKSTTGPQANGAAGSAASAVAANRIGANATSGAAATATARAPIPSAAAQERLQKLNQVLENLGINPEQISYSERVSLLPLTNDPAALEQVVQGLQTQASGSQQGTASATPGGTAVSPSIEPNGAIPPNGAVSEAAQSASASTSVSRSPQNGAGPAAVRNPAIAMLANSTLGSTGQRINISV